jgi:hypothetical protein
VRAGAGRTGRRAQARGRSGAGVREEGERVDVAAAVGGTAGAEAQAAPRPDGAEGLAATDARAFTYPQSAEAEVRGDEPAAADADRHAATRQRPGEGDAARAGRTNDGGGRGGDVDATALAASEGDARGDVEGADDRAAQRPVPARARARSGATAGPGRTVRHHERQHDQGPEGEGGEDERVRARGHAIEATAERRAPSPRRVICCRR